MFGDIDVFIMNVFGVFNYVVVWVGWIKEGVYDVKIFVKFKVILIIVLQELNIGGVKVFIEMILD